MAKELVVASNRHETKVAILEDDQLVEIHFQRTNEYSLAGSIHKGRVTRVLPGMQSAFVDLGLERDTFLYVTDFFEENDEYDRVSTAEERPRREPQRQRDEPREQQAPPPAAVAATPSPVVPVPPVENTVAESAESRERRGRRSRRRRNRGRGFPESKYAAAPPPGEPAVAAPVERVEQFPQSAQSVPFILPGESLAKYSRPSENAERPPAGEPEEPETREEVPIEEPPSIPVEIEEPDTDEEVDIENGETDDDVIGRVLPEENSPEPESTEVEAADDPAELSVEVGAEDSSDVTEPIEEQAVAAAGETSAAEAGAGSESSDTMSASVRSSEFAPRYVQRPSRRPRRRVRGGGPQEGDRRQESPTAQVTGRDKTAPPSISEMLKEGQEILVQVAKEPLGQKGARITSHIALPGRYCVYMPTVEHVGVSRKISTEEERQRLKRVLQTHRAGIPGGFIMRTAGEGKSEEDVAADMTFLYNLWLEIRQRAEKLPAPALIHHDLEIVQRLLRDQLNENFKAIWVDNEDLYENILRFVQRFQPALVSRVKMYTRPEPIFDTFHITQELEKALRPKVWLKSGGYIVINQTEALVAIDVNTGKFVGKSHRLEDTIVKTNTEAIKEIVRQMRLRDLGGIIVVDFIDMDERKNRQKVMQTLEDAMRTDRAPYKVLQFNDFGLVAITRKRVKQSLERTLCSPCPYCDAAGYVKSVQTVIAQILEEAHKISRSLESKDVMLRVHPEVAKVLKSTSNHYLEELEEILGRPVLVTGDPLLHHEKFDLA